MPSARTSPVLDIESQDGIIVAGCLLITEALVHVAGEKETDLTLMNVYRRSSLIGNSPSRLRRLPQTLHSTNKTAASRIFVLFDAVKSFFGSLSFQ